MAVTKDRYEVLSRYPADIIPMPFGKKLIRTTLDKEARLNYTFVRELPYLLLAVTQ